MHDHRPPSPQHGRPPPSVPCRAVPVAYGSRQPPRLGNTRRQALRAINRGSSASEVRDLLSAYLAGEDTCFCLFQAATADAVRALNDEADFALDRITAAVLLYPARPGA